ncbi:MAG: group III truncated hemoglobin [Burkholderiaceae bacterium]|nr:group III truncated hemoglobin [Burkholderiaceae bacterium]
MTDDRIAINEEDKLDTLDEAAIRRMVETFYGRVREDEQLGPIFKAALDGHWPEHMSRMVDFWSTMLLYTKSFDGNVYGKHMAMSGITKEHFARWLGLFRQTVTEQFRDPAAGALLGIGDRIAGSLQLGFFGDHTVRI